MQAVWRGNNLKVRRKELGLTMGQLAEMLNSHRPLISMWESGKSAPTGRFLILLSIALRIEPKELYAIENQEQKGNNGE